MGTRERILTIRLMEKIRKVPEYGKTLGIEVKQGIETLLGWEIGGSFIAHGCEHTKSRDPIVTIRK